MAVFFNTLTEVQMTWCSKFHWETVCAAEIKCESLCSVLLCHMALPPTHPLWEQHWRLVAPWGRLSANLFCAVNNDKRAWALFNSTVQAVIVRSTRSLANVCVGSVQEEDEAGWLAAGQAGIQTTSVETEQERKRVSGEEGEEELGSAFLSQGHNSLPCKHWGKAVDQSTGCLTWA